MIIFFFSLHVFAQEVPQKETEQLDFAQGLLSRGLYPMAVAEYEKFITAYPQSVYLEEAYLSIAEAYFLAQDFPKAADAFNHFKELFPNAQKIPNAVLRLGQIYIQQKKYDEALKELTSIELESRLKGETLQSFYYYIAKAYGGKNDNPSALSYFQKVCAVADSISLSAYAFQEIAQIEVENTHYTEAIDAYTKAFSFAQEESLKGYLIDKIGETQFLSGNYAESINRFHQVLDQYPGFDVTKDAFTNLLLAHLNLKQYDLLLSEYQNYAQFSKEEGPYFDIYFTVAKSYIELKKYEEALVLLDKILSFPALKEEDKRKDIFKKADIFIKQKKYQDGVTLLEGPLPGTADDGDQISFLKAQGYFGLGDFQKAANFFQDVKTNHPNSNFVQAAQLGLAHTFQEIGDFKQSAEQFFDYYGKEQDSSLKGEALYNAALMETKLNANDQAMAKAEEYLKTFVNGVYYEKVILLLGDLYSKSNQSDKAVGLIKEYLSHPQGVQRSDTLYFLLGYNQQLLGHSDEALESYAKVFLNKEDPKFYLSALKNSAGIYLSQKKDSFAAPLFDRIITDLDQKNLDLKTYLWLCYEYLKEKKFNDVLRIADAAEKHFSNEGRGEISYFRAEAYRELKSFDNAAQFYDIVLSSLEKNMYTAAAHIGKGLSFCELNRLDEAKSEFQKAIEENADDHTITMRARFEIANISSIQKNFEEAIKFYLLVGTIYEDDYYCPESFVRAAGILENLNRKEEALKIYQEILDKYNNSPAATRAKERVSF